MRNVTVPEEILVEDIARLKKIYDGMWPHMEKRMKEKAEEDWTRGSYTKVPDRLLVENLAKNLIQFNDSLITLQEHNTIKQGADILNLTLMCIDKGTQPGRWFFAKD